MLIHYTHYVGFIKKEKSWLQSLGLATGCHCNLLHLQSMHAFVNFINKIFKKYSTILELGRFGYLTQNWIDIILS